MERFMLIVRENLEKIGRLTPKDRFDAGPNMTNWVKSLIESGNYIAGEPLTINGRLVTKDGVQDDGPFIKEKAGISGYDIILAEDLNQAVAIAQTCPMVMSGFAIREVRPFQAPLF